MCIRDSYQRLRSVEKKYNNTHIHVVQFEDLIYKYDETVERIMDILGVDKTKHIEKKQNFNPDKSINNTQLFNKEAYKSEAEVIEEELKEYIYDFPYKNDADMKQSF